MPDRTTAGPRRPTGPNAVLPACALTQVAVGGATGAGGWWVWVAAVLLLLPLAGTALAGWRGGDPGAQGISLGHGRQLQLRRQGGSSWHLALSWLHLCLAVSRRGETWGEREVEKIERERERKRWVIVPVSALLAVGRFHGKSFMGCGLVVMWRITGEQADYDCLRNQHIFLCWLCEEIVVKNVSDTKVRLTHVSPDACRKVCAPLSLCENMNIRDKKHKLCATWVSLLYRTNVTGINCVPNRHALN